jgi:transposase-like protein
MSQEGGGEKARPDSEVKTLSRRFSAKEKLRILEEADACTEPGEIGALLRREGIYSLYLSRWRRARDRGQLDGLSKKKRGPKRTVDLELAEERGVEAGERTPASPAGASGDDHRGPKKLSQIVGLETSVREDKERG